MKLMDRLRATNYRQLYYHLRHNYLTPNNIVIAVALVIAASWAWGSIGVMQRNYTLQRALDDKHRQQQLAELEVATLEYEQNYLRSAEYQELAVRERLGYGQPGEKSLILAPHTDVAYSLESHAPASRANASREPSNFQAWMNFLLGGNAKQR